MSTRKSKGRPSAEKRRAATSLQATLDREEARRKVLLRKGVMVGAAALVIIAAAAAVVWGQAATGGGVAAPASAVEQSVAIVPSVVETAPPAAELTAPAEEPAAPAKVPAPAPAAVPDQAKPEKPVAAAPAVAKAQNFRIAIGVSGYSPDVIRASKDSSIKLTVDKGQGCAAGFLIPALNISSDNTGGPVTIDLGRVPAGTYQYSCGMEMVTGTLIVS